jgi:hypothetical protein
MSRWRRDTHQCFAEIAAFQHTNEGGRRISTSPPSTTRRFCAPVIAAVADGRIRYRADITDGLVRVLLSTSRMVTGRRNASLHT